MAKSTGECGVRKRAARLACGIDPRSLSGYTVSRLLRRENAWNPIRGDLLRSCPIESWPIFCDGLSESRLNARDGLKLLMGRSVHIDHNLRLLLRLSPDSTPAGIGDRRGSGYRESPLEGVQ